MRAMTEPAQRTDFTDLVRERRAELGISLRELEVRSVHEPSGTQAKFGWLSKLENGKPVDTPKPGLLEALAVGLSLPVKILKIAASRQFLDHDSEADASVVWSEDLTTRIIVARAEEMSDEDRQQLAAIAETFARRRTQRNESVEGKSDE
jgi:transcriptional regulator with XRE-family HTH domain